MQIRSNSFQHRERLPAEFAAGQATADGFGFAPNRNPHLAWDGVPAGTKSFALESPEAGARWLAATLAQVADLHEQDLFPHRLIRLDDIAGDATAVAQAIADSLQIRVAVAPQQALGPARFDAGHWRDFRDSLGDAFDLLTPVAQRLGYPAE